LPLEISSGNFTVIRVIMKRLSRTFAILAIVFAVSSAFRTNHKTVYQDWFAIDGRISGKAFATCFANLATYDPCALPEPPPACSSEELTNICAVQLIHVADEFELQQSDLTGKSFSDICLEIRYKN